MIQFGRSPLYVFFSFVCTTFYFCSQTNQNHRVTDSTGKEFPFEDSALSQVVMPGGSSRLTDFATPRCCRLGYEGESGVRQKGSLDFLQFFIFQFLKNCY